MADNKYYVQLESAGTLNGTVSSPCTTTGKLANATLRGESVEFRMNGTILQYKYENDEQWIDLVNLGIFNYEDLQGLPTINGKEIKGEINTDVITPGDALTNMEIENLLRNSD